MKAITYPFTPRSTSDLQPGQFWAVPLSNGFFTCGRVIELPPRGNPGSRISFLAGLLDWCERKPPDFDSIEGAKCFEQGVAHIKAITEHGGEILGIRQLSLDQIEPFLFRDQVVLQGSHIQLGYQRVRRATSSDISLPVISTWGYNVVRVLAEHHFLVLDNEAPTD
jgi:hypothetical protein